MQDGYPIVLRLRGASCTIVGGGGAAARKIGPLLEAGARVTVISPGVHPDIRALGASGRLTVIGRPYGGAADLQGAALVFAATDRDGVNAAVCRDAEALGIPVCDAGRPERGTFLLPAVLRQGRLVLAVSTSGASPSLARKIRDELADAYGPEYAEALDVLAELRRKAMEAVPDPAERRALLKALGERDFPGLARAGRLAAYRERVLAALAETGGPDRWRRILDDTGGQPPAEKWRPGE